MMPGMPMRGPNGMPMMFPPNFGNMNMANMPNMVNMMGMNMNPNAKPGGSSGNPGSGGGMFPGMQMMTPQQIQ